MNNLEALRLTRAEHTLCQILCSQVASMGNKYQAGHKNAQKYSGHERNARRDTSNRQHRVILVLETIGANEPKPY